MNSSTSSRTFHSRVNAQNLVNTVVAAETRKLICVYNSTLAALRPPRRNSARVSMTTVAQFPSLCTSMLLLFSSS